MKNNERICGCGTCLSHYDRALKITRQMAADGECCVSIAAVGAAMHYIASAAPLLGRDIELTSNEAFVMTLLEIGPSLEHGAETMARFFEANPGFITTGAKEVADIMNVTRGELKEAKGD